MNEWQTDGRRAGRKSLEDLVPFLSDVSAVCRNRLISS